MVSDLIDQTLNTPLSWIIFANGQRFRLIEEGSGPLVLFVHGFPDGSSAWRLQLKALGACGFRAVAMDMRGYGRSSKPPNVDDYSVMHLVADLIGIVEALGERSAVVVGHDWGSVVAWTAAWTRPDVFRAVVGMSVPFGGRSLIPFAGASSFGEFSPTEAHRMIAGDTGAQFYQEYWSIPGLLESEIEPDVRGFLEGMYYSFSGDVLGPDYIDPVLERVTAADVLDTARSSAMCVAPGNRMVDALARAGNNVPAWIAHKLELLTPEFERSGFTPALNWYRALDRSWEELEPFADRPIIVPALFICGAADPPLQWGVEAIRAAGRTLPELRGMVIVPRTGHWVAEEQPDIVNAALLEFLKGL